jgi:hypothetical protein
VTSDAQNVQALSTAQAATDHHLRQVQQRHLENQKQRQKRANEKFFEPGQLVDIWRPYDQTQPGASRRFQRKWTGPFEIDEHDWEKPHRVIIKPVPNSGLKPFKKAVHVDHVRLRKPFEGSNAPLLPGGWESVAPPFDLRYGRSPEWLAKEDAYLRSLEEKMKEEDSDDDFDFDDEYIPAVHMGVNDGLVAEGPQGPLSAPIASPATDSAQAVRTASPVAGPSSFSSPTEQKSPEQWGTPESEDSPARRTQPLSPETPPPERMRMPLRWQQEDPVTPESPDRPEMPTSPETPPQGRMEMPQEVFIWAPPGKAIVKNDVVTTAEPNNFLYYEVPGQIVEKRRYMGIPTPDGQIQVDDTSYVVMDAPLRRSPRDGAQPMETTPPSSRSSSRGSWKKRYLSPEEEEASRRRRRK